MKPPPPHPLELSPEAMRSMVHHAMEHIQRFLGALPRQPMHSTRGGKKLARSLREPMPEEGRSFERLVRLLFGRILPASLNAASPGYLAYIPGGGLFHTAVADLITAATNRYIGVFVASPGLAQLEENVIQWFCAMLGLPPGSGGILTTGGSMANLVAVVTARRERLPEDFLGGVIYTSEEAHHSVRKAALIAGFPASRVRALPTDEHFRLPPGAVAEAVRQDRERGLTPFLLVASAGTTSTGAVDDLARLSDIATKGNIWFHVDAAYGGFFALTERGRAALRGIERADSVTLDPHKSLFLPYGTGCLVVRDREALRRAHSVQASYMPAMQTEEGMIDFCELGPELSREVRGLRVWLPLKMHGAGVFRAELDEKLDLARQAADAIRATPGLEVVAEPELSVLAFRARCEGMTSEDAEVYNRRLCSKVNEKQRVLLTGAVVKGRFLIRMAIVSFRTHADRVAMALEDLEKSLAELSSQPPCAAAGRRRTGEAGSAR